MARAMAILLVAVLACPTGAAGEKKGVVDFAGLVARAKKSSRVAVARTGIEAARARKFQADWWWLPRLESSVVGGPAPDVSCVPSEAECLATTPANLGLSFDGPFVRLDATITFPLLTFGKAGSGLRAADAGVRAAEALAEQSERDVIVDAAKAYFAVKLGRELLLMLDEGMDIVDKELRRIEQAKADGDDEIDDADRRRLLVMKSEIAVRQSEARKLVGNGLAGVRYVSEDDGLDVDDAPLVALASALPELDAAMAQAREKRPDVRAAREGAVANRGLVELEKARYWPDLALVGRATLASAPGADDPENAFLNDPLNARSGALGLALRWNVDWSERPAKVAAARADAARADATARGAIAGAGADAQRSLADAEDARDRLAAARQGEKEARAWLVSQVQAEAAGLVDSKELADAVVAWFTMRARRLQATFDWNVAVVVLWRATGGADVPPTTGEKASEP